MKKFLLIILFLISSFSLISEPLLTEGRNLFYKSREDEKVLEKAIETFRALYKKDYSYIGVSLVYIGSLTSMKALHTIWPQKKYNYAIEGIKIMEEGLSHNYNNIESLFIYGSTCYYLPFFFGKASQAEESLKKIVKLIDDNSEKIYSKTLLSNALKFIKENIKLNNEEIKKVDNFIKKLS